MPRLLPLAAMLAGPTLLLSGCGDSAESRSEGIADLQAIKQRWDDGVNVASSTSRIALSGPAMNVQQIRRDLDGVKTSECLADAKSALAEGMDATISGVLAFMGDSDSGGLNFAMGSLRAGRYDDIVSLCGMSESDAKALLAQRDQEAREQLAREEKAAAEAKAKAEKEAAEAKARCEASRQAHLAGSEFSDTLSGGGKGPAMVVVPCGSFSMGSTEETNEQPVHVVSIAASFALAKYEVSFAEYEAFAKATGRSEPSDSGWGRGERPVINVSWDDATAYAAWLSQQTGKTYRLPTEAEWEYAARAGSTTKYPWGDEVGLNNANCDGCGSQWDNKQTAPVGSFAANAFGLHEMHGNVWEWVQDCYHSSYEGAPADGAAREQCDSSSRVLRGGSWYTDPAWLRSALRHRLTASSTLNYLGFRLVQDLE
jgi:formylglycine-generating enzyme required for sulfatase activity